MHRSPLNSVRPLVLWLVLALAVVACATSDPAEETTTETATETTTASPPNTSPDTTTTTAPPTRTLPPTPVETRLGIGDSRYPNLGNGGYDVTHYTVDLTFDPTANTINALVGIDAVATEPLDAFSIDFTGFEVTSIEVNEIKTGGRRIDGELIIDTPTTITVDESFTTQIAYNGTPAPVLSQALPFELGWRTATDGVAYVVSEPDGGHSWLPLNDHPSDKATYTFMITVPDPLVVAANGILVERITDLGWSTWVWETSHPMASYLATVVIGELLIVDDPGSSATSGVPVRNVLPPDLAASPPEALATQGEMIAFFSDLFGPYPLEAYGIAVVEGFEAALENQTLSIFGRDLVELPQLFETVLVHELAHQWFGNSVTPADWGDIWLNEGFATYAEWLWIENQRGPAALDATVSGERDRLALTSDLPPPGNPPADDLFNISVYNWGALTLHALRIEIGDDAFFETLRSYFDRYRNSVVTTADFVEIAEDVAGGDLTELFDTWLFSDEVPDLPTGPG